jgi:predicted Zn-dependent protease
VLKAQPDNAAAKTALAQVAWGGGRREDAIRRWRRCAAPMPRTAPALLLAQYLQARGDNARALEVAREASTAHPENAEAATPWA